MHLYTLQQYKGPFSRYTCPQCNQRNELARYLNNETGELLPEHVGRCNRESSCGYHLSPKEYFKSNGIEYKPSILPEKIVEEQPIDFMPLEYVEKSMKGFDQSNFAIYLRTLFGKEVSERLCQDYFIGRSKFDNGKANIFWRMDSDYKIRTGKIMFYNPITGKRNKEMNPTWVHSQINSFNYQLCFFGEHLINEDRSKTIGIVESEKTAVIASVFMPGITWIATGGNSGCKWREYAIHKVLQNRNVILFPDFGYYNKRTLKTCWQEWNERANNIKERMKCNLTVSRVLEDALPESERINDYDLADMFIKQDEKTGIALSEYGYPVIWDRNL